MRFLSCYYIVPLILIFIISSCKTSKDQAKADPPPSTQQEQAATTDEAGQNGALEEAIIGDWEWQKTICCGRTPFTETAESLKAPKILKFQQGGVLQYFSGDALTATQTYKISYGLQDDNRPVITIGASRPGLVSINGETLIIDYGYVDLQQEFYVRKK